MNIRSKVLMALSLTAIAIAGVAGVGVGAAHGAIGKSDSIAQSPLTTSTPAATLSVPYSAVPTDPSLDGTKVISGSSDGVESICVVDLAVGQNCGLTENPDIRFGGFSSGN